MRVASSSWAVAALAVGLALREARGACSDADSYEECIVEADGCTWELVSSGSSTSGSCVSCGVYTDDEWLCNYPCTLQDDGTCGLPVPGPMSTAAPVDSTAGTAAQATTVRWEMASGELTMSRVGAVADALVEALGGEWATLVGNTNDVEKESCGEVPLCSTAPGMIDIVEDWSEVVLPPMDSCCPARDTQPTATCQSVDLSSQVCRVTGVQEPFCADVEEGMELTCQGIRQAIAEDDEESVAILFQNLQFQDGGLEGGCCFTCTAYGDPNLISFNGTKTSWRLCDARDLDDGCKLTKSACSGQLDHEGNECLWKQQRNWANWKDGGPCQPSVDAGPSWLLLYEVDDSFVYWINQEERGVIRDVLIITEDGNFSMNAMDCFGDDTSVEGSWTWSPANMEQPDLPEWTSGWRFVQEEPYDRVWYVYDGNTQIQSNIRCTATRKGNTKNYGNQRFNVEAIVEPVEVIEDSRSNPGGFCYTTIMVDPSHSAASNQSYWDHIAIDNVCKEIADKPTEQEELAVARLLCQNPAISISSMDSCLTEFCETYSLPNLAVDECVTMMVDESPRELEEAFCQVDFSNEVKQGICMDYIDEFGWEPVVEDFFNKRGQGGVNQTCVEDISQLNVTLDTCESGVQLQYQDVAGDDSTWTNYAAFPASRAVCGNELRVLYVDHPTLFTKPIRFQQCTRDVACSALERCEYVDGFTGTIAFDYPQLAPPSVPTVPSQAPSEAPSAAPDGECVQRPCLGDEEPEVRENTRIDTDECQADIEFEAEDLDSDAFCACDFTRDNSIGSEDGGSFARLDVACDDLDDADKEAVCSRVCQELQGSDFFCAGWELEDNDCRPYQCPDNTAQFVEQGSFSAAQSCEPKRDTTESPTDAPSVEPAGWTPPTRRQLRASAAADDAGTTKQELRRRALANEIFGAGGIEPRPMSQPGRREDRERRRLAQPGNVVYTAEFWVLFPDVESQEASAEGTSEDPDFTAETLQGLMRDAPAFEDVEDSLLVTGVYAAPSYNISDLRFDDTQYDPALHNTSEFTDGICEVLRRTIRDFRPTIPKHGKADCSKTLLNFTAYADDIGRLAVMYRITDMGVGGVQGMLQDPDGKALFNVKLGNSNVDTVNVLVLTAAVRLESGTASSAGSGGGMSTPGAVLFSLFIIGGVLAAGLVVYRRKQLRDREIDLERNHDLAVHQRRHHSGGRHFNLDEDDDEDDDAYHRRSSR